MAYFSRSAVLAQSCRLLHAVAHRTVFSLNSRRVRAADAYRVADVCPEHPDLFLRLQGIVAQPKRRRPRKAARDLQLLRKARSFAH